MPAIDRSYMHRKRNCEEYHAPARLLSHAQFLVWFEAHCYADLASGTASAVLKTTCVQRFDFPTPLSLRALLSLTNDRPTMQCLDGGMCSQGDALEGVDSDDHNESFAHTKNDGRPEERELFDADTVPARKKKRRALSVEEEPFATYRGSLTREMSEPDKTCTEEHPLQASEITGCDFRRTSGSLF